MTIDDAVRFETNRQHKITQKLKPLQDVGLGYVQLGQSSSTLSFTVTKNKTDFFSDKRATKERNLFVFERTYYWDCISMI
jgi:excinuclease ABC subunit A